MHPHTPVLPENIPVLPENPLLLNTLNRDAIALSMASLQCTAHETMPNALQLKLSAPDISCQNVFNTASGDL